MNSAKQVADYLETLGHECKLVSVIDGNFIDKELFEYRNLQEEVLRMKRNLLYYNTSSKIRWTTFIDKWCGNTM